MTEVHRDYMLARVLIPQVNRILNTHIIIENCMCAYKLNTQYIAVRQHGDALYSMRECVDKIQGIQTLSFPPDNYSLSLTAV